MKNKISTLGYFTKRLKDNGYIVWKMFNQYNVGDQRKWTVLVNPSFHSLYITCFVNMESVDDTPEFQFDDGNTYMRKDTRVKTNSIQSVITHMLDYGVTANSDEFKKNESPPEFKNND